MEAHGNHGSLWESWKRVDDSWVLCMRFIRNTGLFTSGLSTLAAVRSISVSTYWQLGRYAVGPSLGADDTTLHGLVAVFPDTDRSPDVSERTWTS